MGVASASSEQAVRFAYGAVLFGMVVAQLFLCGLFAAYEASLPVLEKEAGQIAAQKAKAAKSS
jgi:hypothetical protein